jgi:hypothetical protein
VNIYIVGSTSQFAIDIAEVLENDHNVFKFGRKNLDYSNYSVMQEEFAKYPKPDLVIFNQHVSGIRFDNFDVGQSTLDFIVGRNFNALRDSFYGKIFMYDILKDADTFVFITSSITQIDDKEFGLNQIVYRHLRASEQQLMKSIFLEGKNAYGLCPGGMDEDPKGYAQKVARMILKEDKELNGKVTLVKGYNE